MNMGILFRGKRLDNGEWAYGVPLQYLGGQVGIVKCTEETRILPYDGDTEYHCIEELFSPKVDNATVGQYTGRTDKNGKRIFEGDIVHCRGGEFFHGFHEIDHYELVNDITDGICIYLGEVESVEVIGNIYENKELIDFVNKEKLEDELF